MISSLLAAVAAAPIFWLLVPRAARRNALAGGSLLVLAAWDARLVPITLGLVLAVFLAARAIAQRDRRVSGWICAGGLAVLATLFAFNKLSFADPDPMLVSTGGVALIGISYFVLKAASILIEVRRRTLAPPSFPSLARWLLFFPIFTSGPIEAFRHFDDQEPRIDLDRAMRGLERILFGCTRALVIAHALGQWTMPILAEPAAHSVPTLLLAMYALSVRIYFDFAGYSDIAIGLASLYGYEIQENFDNPLTQRNIVALWQRWHMTLTAWLRIYVFTPYSRVLMKRGRGWHRPAVWTGQVVTMAACGLWHDLTVPFLLWGVLHGAALAWTGTGARDLGRRLPPGLVGWWRASPLGYAMSALVTLTAFSAINVLAFADLGGTARFFRALVGI